MRSVSAIRQFQRTKWVPLLLYTMTEITLEIDGNGDTEQFISDLIEMANGDPAWNVSLVEMEE